MANKNILKEKSFQFSLAIIQAYKILVEQKEFVMSKQMLRSGTSVGASICESEFAVSKPDFINKFHLSLKEANETRYWLELLFHSNYLSKENFDKLNFECEELIRLLVSSLKTLKENKP